jgi:hypothetical protein
MTFFSSTYMVLGNFQIVQEEKDGYANYYLLIFTYFNIYLYSTYLKDIEEGVVTKS